MVKMILTQVRVVEDVYSNLDPGVFAAVAQVRNQMLHVVSMAPLVVCLRTFTVNVLDGEQDILEIIVEPSQRSGH